MVYSLNNANDMNIQEYSPSPEQEKAHFHPLRDFECPSQTHSFPLSPQVTTILN